MSAASEISEVCGAPVGSLEHSVDILVGDVPPLLHDCVAVLVLADAGGVKRGGAGVDEVDEAVLGNALGASLRRQGQQHCLETQPALR